MPRKQKAAVKGHSDSARNGHFAFALGAASPSQKAAAGHKLGARKSHVMSALAAASPSQKAAAKGHNASARESQKTTAPPAASPSQKAAAGRTSFAHKGQDLGAPAAASLSTNDDVRGPTGSATQTKVAPPSSPPASDLATPVLSSDQNAPAGSLAPIIAEIRAWHRRRVFAMDQRKRSDLALGAFIRRELGWSRALPKADADKISKLARDLIALGEKVFKGKATGVGNAEFGRLGMMILLDVKARAHWNDYESEATKEMERLARSLPVWPEFGEPIKGFGARSLAVIIGEAGDLSLYANPGKLWKRMGLAVMDGVRQGGLRKNASAEDWIAHGYNAKRRSFMFVIGDVLVKNQNPYREVYLARKQYERDRAVSNGLIVAPAAKIPDKRKHEFMSDGHVHRRAQRYMEKRLLKHLWQAWRRASKGVSPKVGLPAADSQRQTNTGESTNASLSAPHRPMLEASTVDDMAGAPIPAKAGRRKTARSTNSNSPLSSAAAI